VSTRPSDYRPPPNSPHAGINCHGHNPRPMFVVVPILPNSIRCTEEGNHLKPRRTSHDLAHSTRLPKSSGYNLKWPRVTLIQVTLVTGPLTKASYHDTHPKLCRNSPCEQTLHPKPLGAPFVSLGKTWLQPPGRHLTPPGAMHLPVVLPHHHRLAEPTLPSSATRRQWPLPLF